MLIESGTARLLGGELGMAYRDTQGGPSDAQKCMALVPLCALPAMGTTLAINVALQRDFALEWLESLRVERAVPLGEIEIACMLSDA